MKKHDRQLSALRETAFHSASRYTCEAEVIEGLESFARDEIATLPGTSLLDKTSKPRGCIRFGYDGPLEHLSNLRTVIAIYLVVQFPVPRPKGLLGHEHFTALLRQISTVRSLWPSGSFQTFSIGAAGTQSSVMQRLIGDLATHTGLGLSDEKGDLFIRLIRSRSDRDGWEALIRLTPRPLATRSYRVEDMEGALNATVAQVMVLMMNPDADDIILNTACGSGTLMIERLNCGPAGRVVGCDVSGNALEAARTNIEAAGYSELVELLHCDARSLPLASNCVTAACADLPFGQLVGSHTENRTLYPEVLAETARVARRGALFAVITHEVRLMENVLRSSRDWDVEHVYPITLGGLHPRIFLLRRK